MSDYLGGLPPIIAASHPDFGFWETWDQWEIPNELCRHWGCFKPNDFQKAGVFDETLVLDQIVQPETQKNR